MSTLFDTPALDSNLGSETIVLVSIPREIPTTFYNWVCIGISRGCQITPFVLVSIPREIPTTFYNWVCIGLSRGNQITLFVLVSIPREMSILFDTPALDNNLKSETIVLVSIPREIPTRSNNWVSIGDLPRMSNHTLCWFHFLGRCQHCFTHRPSINT